MAFLAAASAAALLLAAAPAHAESVHGAIAFGKSAEGSDAAYGFAWNYGTRDEALSAALNACLGAGGADCALLARFENGCGALAMDRYGRAQGKSAMSQERAEARAMQACKTGEEVGCAIVAAVCAEPGKQTRSWSGSDSVLAASKGGAARQETRPAAAGEVSEQVLTRADRIGVQRGLAALDFDAGLADGMFGPRTRAAIRAWQQAKGLAPTGFLTSDEARAIAAAAESGEGAAPRVAPVQARAAARLQPKCKGMAKGSECWKEVSHRPGCHVWNTEFDPAEEVAWTGACPGEAVHGRGTLLGNNSDWYSEAIGEMVRGRKKGSWTERYYYRRDETKPFNVHDKNSFEKGPYVDGKAQGRWIIRWGAGVRFEGEFRDGMANGFGIITYANGRKSKGQWRDGCFEGRDGKKIWLGTTKKACGFE